MGIPGNIILLKIGGFSSNMSRSLGGRDGEWCLEMVYKWYINGIFIARA